MYNIVITDDEPLERLSVQQMLVDKLGRSCTTALAANGREAIEAAGRMRADIAVMDIEMPGMNGLEASRIIREQNPDCRVVFLTAYSEFDYVKQALELGANDFLLKPCSESDVCRVIDGVIRHIDCQRSKREEYSLSARRADRLARRVEREFVLTAMGGGGDAAQLEGRLAELDIAFQAGVCLVMRGEGIHPRHLRHMLEGCCWPDGMRLLCCEHDDSLYGMVLSAGGRADGEEIAGRLRQLARQERQFTGRQVHCGVSREIAGLGEVQRAFLRARLALTACGPDRPVEVAAEAVGADGEDAGIEALIAQNIMLGDAREATRYAAVLLDWLCVQQADWRLLSDMLLLYLRRILGLLGAPQLEPPGLSFAQCGSKREGMDKLAGLIAALTGALNDGQTGRLGQMRSEIERYMRSHYAQDISLQQVAAEMNYSEAYFSKLFKQCFHKNFIAYLTELRVAEARKLLRNPVISIKDVGARVGYRDNNYFTKVFRRTEGCSPSEYREGRLPPGGEAASM